jgi:ParB family transcriptional regulator, chromosome partitioning protein
MNTSAVTDLPLDLIDAGDNDRTHFEGIEELADSIRRLGVLSPITVRPVSTLTETRYELVCGERRTRASRVAGMATIPAIVKALSDEEAADLMLAENTGRVDLDVIDEARAYAKRIALGATMQEVAAKAGVTWQRVLTRTRLLQLVPELQHLVRLGELTGTAGLLMADLDANRQRICLDAIRTGITNAGLASLARRLKADQEQEVLFDADSFLQVEEYVAEAEAAVGRRITAADLRSLAARMAAALAALGAGAELVAEAALLGVASAPVPA